MNRRWLSLATVWFGMVGLVGYEVIVARAQTRELRSLQQRAAEQDRQLSESRRQHETTARQLHEAEEQLAAIPETPLFHVGATAELRADISVWLGRVKQLHALFEERPDRRIPEMRLLPDTGWLRTARRFQLDSDDNIRRAMADIRAEAVGNFSRQLVSAARAYANANKDRTPADVSELAPFFDPPADPDMLARYEIAKREAPPPVPGRPGIVRAGPGPWVVQNAIATDPDYETRIAVGSNGSVSSGTGPFSWEPNFRERYIAAAKIYAQAHEGTSPTNPVDVLPYFNPPLDAAVAERVIKATKQKQ
jgi:hypothetical protein